MAQATKPLFQGRPVGLAPPTLTGANASATPGLLVLGTTYGFRASALSAAGESNLSPETLVTMLGANVTVGLTATANPSGSTAPNGTTVPGATSINFYQGPPGGPWLLLGNTAIAANAATASLNTGVLVPSGAPPAGNTSITNGGVAVSPSAPLYTPPALSASISGAVLAGRTATYTSTAPHGFLPGDAVSVAGLPAPFSGRFTILTATSTTFTCTIVAPDASTGTAGTAKAGTKTLLREAIFANPSSGIAACFLSLVPYGGQIDGTHQLIPSTTVQPAGSASGPLMGTFVQILYPGDSVVGWSSTPEVVLTLGGVEGVV